MTPFDRVLLRKQAPLGRRTPGAFARVVAAERARGAGNGEPVWFDGVVRQAAIEDRRQLLWATASPDEAERILEAEIAAGAFEPGAQSRGKLWPTQLPYTVSGSA